MRKTKVICTIGPACEDSSVLTEMCGAGMNVISGGSGQKYG